MKVAIVGLSDSSRHEAPWGNPEWELWGLGWDVERYHFHRVFEMHDMAELVKTFDPLPEYLEKINHCQRLYMQERYAEVPRAERYPHGLVNEVCGDYWESSVGYMLGLAIAEGATDIGLYGVDMKADEEHGYQQPNATYLLGLARGKGIRLHIPEVCPLLKHSGKFGYAGRYGITHGA